MTQINDRRALTETVPVTPAAPGSGDGRPSTNGHGPHRAGFADGAKPGPSDYLDLLPALYSMAENEFAGRFLRIFEDVLDPISVTVDNQPYYFDPLLAPREILDYMATWVALDEGEEWPLARRRALVAAAATLYRFRGTPQGIKHHVGIYTGGLPLLMERTNGFRLDGDARLGVNTMIGEDRPRTFTVTIGVRHPEEIDQDTVRTIIDSDKPVETTYILRVVQLATP